MNDFQPIEAGSGILKDSYPEEAPQLRALRMRRKRMEDKTTIPSKDDLEGSQGE